MSAISSSATPAWEQSKENAAPLERGRNVAALERRQRGICQQAVEEKVQDFESLVRPSEALHVTEMDGDPLAHWLAYIKYYQESFPSDTHDNFLIMERCVRAFVKMKQYANDDRFVGVCAKYADKTKDPGQVFKYLHQQKIGTYTALFWIAWGFVAEKDNDFPFAEQIFKKGISKNAEPLQLLKVRHSQFQRRMSRHWLNSSRANDNLHEDEGDDNEHPRSRSTLSGISRDRLRQNDRSARGGQRQPSRSDRPISRSNNRSLSQQQSTGRSNNDEVSSFAIFEEREGENEHYNLDHSFAGDEENDERRVIARASERKKENTLEAERWNERGGLQTSHKRKQPESRGPPPAFSVFVDEECARRHQRDVEEEQLQAERHRQVRDDRTFRDRDREGMAEKLARDPLRYVRDPSMLGSDTVVAPKEDSNDEPKNAEERVKSERKSRTGFSKRLLKNKQGEEQCFDEARALAGAYNLLGDASSNFNLLYTAKTDQSSQMDLADDVECSIDISMVESVSTSAHCSANSIQANELQRGGSYTEGRILFQPDLDAGLNQTALSNASSTINMLDAVGLPAKKEEETINTKFAMKELSMMFSSPAFGIDGTRRLQDQSRAYRIEENSAIENSHGDISFGNVGDVLGNSMLDNSICNIGSEDNRGECKLDTRTAGTKFLGAKALQELKRDPESDASLYSRPRASLRVEAILQNDPPQHRHNDADDNPGFAIFEDSPIAEDCLNVAKGRRIFDENKEARCNGESEGELKVDEKKRFTKFPGQELLDGVSTASSDFEDHDTHLENGDTASISEAIAVLDEGHGTDFSMSCRHRQPTVTKDDDNTATLSLFNEVFQDDDTSSVRSPLVGSSIPKVPLSSGGLFDIYVDDVDEEGHQSPLVASSDSTEGKKGPGCMHRLSSKLEIHQSAVDYTKSHNHNIRMALKRLQNKSIVASDSRAPLVSLLVSSGKVFHLPNAVVPRQLRLKRIAYNTEVSVGKHGGILNRELGRGAYGVVVLMNVSKNNISNNIAIKVQCPTDSLAWEYEVLQRLEDRISRNGKVCSSYAFPRPFGFISLADGGILSMSAASGSGLNLVDLSNFYKLKLGEPVPELIALHYTALMLNVVADMHWHGKILHCDVKPDNFVLSASKCHGNDVSDTEFAGLTLVDFGRAVDLAQYAGERGEVHNVLLHGASAQDEMRCVAMRNEEPWSFDADTFGVVACAHVLLHGTHMKVVKGRNNKWRPTTTLRRYWQQDIWNEVFDSLLNIDEISGAAMSSRALNLRSISRKIDTYLSTEKKSLRSLLSRQANILPDSREKI